MAHLLHDALSDVMDNLLQAFGEVHLYRKEGEGSESRRQMGQGGGIGERQERGGVG